MEKKNKLDGLPLLYGYYCYHMRDMVGEAWFYTNTWNVVSITHALTEPKEEWAKYYVGRVKMAVGVDMCPSYSM